MSHIKELRIVISKLEKISTEARQSQYTVLEAKLEDVIADLIALVEEMEVE